MFSIIGEQDHAPFGAGGVQLVWGQRPDGSHVNVSEVPSGLACGCVCPACGLRLAAHKGRKLAHNYHHVNGQACAGAHETNAHVWAKQILAARKAVWLPAGMATAGNARRRAFAARLFEFDAARLEKREGSIVPDVVLSAGERELIVEIRVTHACDDVKIAKIREQGVSALEIDLSGLRRAESEEAVAVALVGTEEARRAPRDWLYNVKVDEASERLAVEVTRREAEKRARLAEAAARRKATIHREAQSIIRAAASVGVVSPDALREEMQIVASYGLRDHVGLPLEGQGFRVPAILWQSAILSRVVIEGLDRMSGLLPAITPKVAIEAIDHDCLARKVPSFPSDELQAAVLAAEPTFSFPADVIGRYLAHLEKVGILARRHVRPSNRSEFVGWHVSGPTVARLRARQTEFAEQSRRRERARAVLLSIPDRVPASERRGFSLDLWLSRNIEGSRVRFADLVAAGEDEWQAFERAIDEISRMFGDGPPARQTLGLPVAGEIERATARERIAHEEAARSKREAEGRAACDRVHSLSERAVGIFGKTGADEWLRSISPVSPLSFVELARGSYEGFHQAQQTLGSAEREAIDRQRRVREAERCRAALRADAIEAFGSERAEVFLLSTHPRLGTSPWSRCTDAVGLRDCISLLPKRSSAGVSRSVCAPGSDEENR